jgi:FkbM family methyltransferase
MASRTSILRQAPNAALISITGVIATFLTVFLFEALTDRDWTVSDWEWPEVVTLALLSTVGAFWLLGLVPMGRWSWTVRQRMVGTNIVVMQHQVRRVSESGALGLRSRARVWMLFLRELALGPPREARIAVGATHVELGPRTDFPIDWKIFVEVFGDEEYAAPFRGAHVLDVGAHKGYFGAYALANGASFVVSIEPEAGNFEALARSAAQLGSRWRTRNAAVGATSTTGTLLLDRTPWGHSLFQVARPAGEQPVTIITLGQALEELPAGGSRTIVKIDAEGSECDILTTPASLESVDHLIVEWHSEKAPCSEEELIEAVESAGLRRASKTSGLLHFARS